MYQSVKNVFSSFSVTFENRVHWMYVDVKALVTTGVGNLIDPVGLATVLPFQHAATGAAATQAEITAAWTDLKNNGVTLGQAGYQACASRNDLRLSDPAIDNLVSSKLASNEATFLRSFPNFESWPADAQLAGMSMCWALGPAFASQWPQLSAALNAQNWTAAAASCNISTAGNAGVAPRNTADVALFNNAAAVVKNGADPSVVYYPGTVPASSSGGTGTATPGSTGTGTTGAAATGAGSSTPGTSKSSGTSTGSASPGSASPGSGSSGASNTGTGSSDASGTDSTDTDSTGASDSDSTDATDTGSTDPTGSDSDSTDASGTDSTDTGSTDATDTGPTDADGTDSTDSGSTDSGSTDTGGTDSTDPGDVDSSDPGTSDTGDTGSTDTSDSDSDLMSAGSTGS